MPDEGLGPPDVSASPRARVASWAAWRSGDGAAHLVAACFDVTTGGWTPDADGIARGKLHETIAGVAVRAGGAGELLVTETHAEPSVTSRTYAGRAGPDGATRTARSAQGFVAAPEPTLASCFALCVDRASPARCDEAIRSARFSRDFVPPPAPGFALRALSALVHHPDVTAWGGATLLVALGVLAIATRKRPKRRRLR